MPGKLMAVNPPILFSVQDDALPAMRVLSPENHILLLTPTSPKTHEYHYQPLIHTITQRYQKSVWAMDYTPPTNSNKYLPFDTRHERALANEACAGVIVVVQDDGSRTRGCQFDFAKKVWEVVCQEGELPGVLVEIGGVRRPVGDWGTVVYANSMGEGVLEGVADLIFGGPRREVDCSTVWEMQEYQ
jgi:hypothetical protein